MGEGFTPVLRKIFSEKIGQTRKKEVFSQIYWIFMVKCECVFWGRTGFDVVYEASGACRGA